ncbi:hypothetical protein Tco_1235379 [Tanacetum coccineum]
MLFYLIMNLYVPFGILFDPKRYYKDGDCALMLQRPRAIRHMALPPRDQRRRYLRYEGLQYTEDDIADFESRLARIYRREVHRVQVFDFGGLLDLMTEGLSARMLMEHRDAQGAILDLDTPRALQFQLGGARRRLSWRMDINSVNVPYLLARYLRLFAAGRKSGAHISGGKFVARLAEHFRLLTTEILQGLTVIAPSLSVIDMAELVRLQICKQLDDTWAWVAMGPERQLDVAAGAPGEAQDAPVIDEGGQTDPTPVQAP